MKKTLIFLTMICTLFLAGCNVGGDDSTGSSKTDTTTTEDTATETLAETPADDDADTEGDTPTDADDTTTEITVLSEMNFARTEPTRYVTERLQPLVSSATGSKLEALQECIDQMNAMSALAAYKASSGLNECAKEWVEQQGPTGETGHGSDTFDRIKKYCTYSKAGENISYGNSDAKDIVIQLLIDDGVSSRGHRKNILSSDYTHAGYAIGTHATYRYMCVIDFAGGYGEK